MANQPRTNFPNGGDQFSNIVKPVRLDLSFVVTPTNGLGITSLKSNGYIQNVFMYTSTTPASNNGQTNPNPAAGYAMIQLRNNFNAFLGGTATITSTGQTATKIDNSALTAGLVYVISTLGNATTAKWQSIGLPPGVTPAVGVAFVATAVGTGSNVLTSRVMVPNLSGTGRIEFFGNPILTSNSGIYANAGQYLIAQFLSGSAAAPTFTGTAHTLAGTISAGVIPVTTGTAGNAVTNNAGVLESSGGQDLAVNAQTFTGESYTPAGTISAPAESTTPAAPTTASLVNMSLYFDASSVTVDGL